MDKVKRILGLMWMVLGPAIMTILVYSAFQNIGKGKGDIANPLPWAIIIFVFIPVAIGMTIFGWYAWKGEYDGEIKT
jgi:fatty acid desaturase